MMIPERVLGLFRVSELSEYWIVSCKECPAKWSVHRKSLGVASTAPERFKRDAGERAIVQMVEHADRHKPRDLSALEGGDEEPQKGESGDPS